MASIFKKFLNLSGGSSDQTKEAKLYRDLLRHESKIGGQIFGPLPKGHRREFFCLDEHTWIWHEEWKDEHNVNRVQTTKYEVRPGGIVKHQEGKGYHYVSPEEAKKLYKAARIYEQKVKNQIYDPIIKNSQP